MKIDARETGEFEIKCPICGKIIWDSEKNYSVLDPCEHLVLMHNDACDFFLHESPEMIKRMKKIAQDIMDEDLVLVEPFVAEVDLDEVDQYEILEKLVEEHPDELLIELTVTGSGCSGPPFPVTDMFFFKTT